MQVSVGRYKQRNGDIAEITGCDDETDTAYVWDGESQGRQRSWTEEGHYYGACIEDERDLVERIEDAPSNPIFDKQDAELEYLRRQVRSLEGDVAMWTKRAREAEASVS